MIRAMIGSFALSAATIFGGTTLVTSVVRRAVRMRRVRPFSVLCGAARAHKHLMTMRVHPWAQKATAPACSECSGKRHVPCATCDGACPASYFGSSVCHASNTGRGAGCQAPLQSTGSPSRMLWCGGSPCAPPVTGAECNAA